MAFMPVSKKDMQDRGIEQLDFVYIIGDAYVDAPQFRCCYYFKTS